LIVLKDYRGRALPNKVETVLFDYDGTLIEFLPKWWYPLERSFEKVAGAVPEATLIENISRIMTNIPLQPGNFFLLKIMYHIGRMGGLGRLQTIRFMKTARLEFQKSRFINIPVPGIEDALNELVSKGVKVGIVTSASLSEMNSALKDLPFLKSYPWVTRGDVENLKPHAEPIEKGMEILGADPKTTIYVGDFISDIEAGKNAKVMTCGLLGPAPELSKHRLEAGDPDIILESAVKLTEFIL
jgi:HAD superfamily hydrolase (TIGR01549 family)